MGYPDLFFVTDSDLGIEPFEKFFRIELKEKVQGRARGQYRFVNALGPLEFCDITECMRELGYLKRFVSSVKFALQLSSTSSFGVLRDLAIVEIFWEVWDRFPGKYLCYSDSGQILFYYDGRKKRCAPSFEKFFRIAFSADEYEVCELGAT